MSLVQDQKLRTCSVALCRCFFWKILPVLAIFAAFFSLFLLNGGLVFILPENAGILQGRNALSQIPVECALLFLTNCLQSKNKNSCRGLSRSSLYQAWPEPLLFAGFTVNER